MSDIKHIPTSCARVISDLGDLALTFDEGSKEQIVCEDAMFTLAETLFDFPTEGVSDQEELCNAKTNLQDRVQIVRQHIEDTL